MALNPSFSVEQGMAQPPSSVLRSSAARRAIHLDDITMRESIEFEGLGGVLTPAKKLFGTQLDASSVHGGDGEAAVNQSQELELEFGLGDDFNADQSSLEIEVARRESSQRESLAGGFQDVSQLLDDEEQGRVAKDADASLDMSNADLHIDDHPAVDDHPLQFDRELDFNLDAGLEQHDVAPGSEVPFPEDEIPDFPSAAARLQQQRQEQAAKRRAHAQQQSQIRKRKLVKDATTELQTAPNRPSVRDMSAIVMEVQPNCFIMP
jgi:hypothetical protein